MLFCPGKELDGNEIEVTLAKPVDKDHRQAKAAAKAVMSATTYPSFTPYDYPTNSAAYGFPAYGSQYFMYGSPVTSTMGWELAGCRVTNWQQFTMVYTLIDFRNEMKRSSCKVLNILTSFVWSTRVIGHGRWLIVL